MDRYIVVRTEWDFARKNPGQIGLGPYTYGEALSVVQAEMFFGVSKDDLMIVGPLSLTSRSLCGGCGRRHIPDECPCMDQ